MPQTQDADIQAVITELSDQAPSGYVAALHLGYHAPQLLFQAFPNEWIDTYSKESMMLQDPALQWGMSDIGTRRWSDLEGAADNPVLLRSAEFGLRYGIVHAHADDVTRSIFTAARDDREFTDAEINALVPIFVKFHELTRGDRVLSPEFLAKLRGQAVRITQGFD